MDNSELTKAKDEYLRLLNTLIVKPKDAPGYYPAEAQTQLYALEGRIKMLYSLVGEQENNWCKTEKNKVLKASFIDTAPRKRRIYAAVVIAAVVGMFFLVRLISYLGSISDINSFEDKIKTGDSYVSQSKHNNAIDSYIDAYNNYDGYKNDDYKERAFAKIKTSLNEIIKKAEVDNNQLYIAIQTVQNLLNNSNLSKEDKTFLQQQEDMLSEKATVRVKTSYDNFAFIIQKNNGKLDDEGKKLLNELLLLSPKDYWLNFIKNKENEQNR